MFRKGEAISYALKRLASSTMRSSCFNSKYNAKQLPRKGGWPSRIGSWNAKVSVWPSLPSVKFAASGLAGLAAPTALAALTALAAFTPTDLISL